MQQSIECLHFRGIQRRCVWAVGRLGVAACLACVAAAAVDRHSRQSCRVWCGGVNSVGPTARQLHSASVVLQSLNCELLPVPSSPCHTKLCKSIHSVRPNRNVEAATPTTNHTDPIHYCKLIQSQLHFRNLKVSNSESDIRTCTAYPMWPTELGICLFMISGFGRIYEIHW